jgi:hypothetical protein
VPEVLLVEVAVCVDDVLDVLDDVVELAVVLVAVLLV